MKKGITLFILIVIIIIGLSTYLYSEEKRSSKVITSKYAQIKQISWENKIRNPGNINIRLNSPEKLLKEVDRHVEQICAYLEMKEKLKEYKRNKIEIEFTEDSSFSNGKIFLNKKRFHYDLAPIVHELTHFIDNYSFSRSLREGFACFMQDKFGNNGAPYNFSYPIFPLSKELIKEYPKIIDAVGKKGELIYYFNKTETIEITVAYNLSYSFTKYLIQEYGKEKFLMIYDKENLYQHYQKVYGKSLRKLKNDWLEFIEDTELIDYTFEEWLKKIIKEKEIN